MRNRWSHMLSGLALVSALTFLGCGPSTTTPPPAATQTPEAAKAEGEKQEGALMGEPAKPEEKKAEEKPAEPAAKP